MPDPDALGLDAMFPAVLLALILPALRDRATLSSAVVGAVVALATTPFLPAGLPVLIALVGGLLSVPGSRTAASKEGRVMTEVMAAPVLVVGGIAVLAAGTFAFRFAGPALRTKVDFPPRATNCSRRRR